MICPVWRLHPKLSQNHWKKQKETVDCRDVHICSLGCWCSLDALWCTRISPIFLCFLVFSAWLKGCLRSQISFRTGRVVSFFGAEFVLQSVAPVGSRGIPMGEMSFLKILLSLLGLGIILVCSPRQGPEPLKNAVSIYSIVIYSNL